MDEKIHDEIGKFVGEVVRAMGLSLGLSVRETEDGPRVDLEGEGGEILLRRKGEALDALQQIANILFRDRLGDKQRIGIDYLGFRRDKETELRQMAQFLADKAKRTGMDQVLGPLNPYERRIVHMAVSDDSAVRTESIGDTHMKKVVIALRGRQHQQPS
jgi:spoIIIJ-associated protein